MQEKLIKTQEKLVYNEKELADVLGVKPYTIRLWRLQQGLPCWRTSGQIFYRLSSVTKWMDEQEREEARQHSI